MQVWIVKLLINAIIKALNRRFNLNNIKEYVEEDNELDIKVKSLYKHNMKYGKSIEELEKDVAILKKDKSDILKRIRKLGKK